MYFCDFDDDNEFFTSASDQWKILVRNAMKDINNEPHLKMHFYDFVINNEFLTSDSISVCSFFDFVTVVTRSYLPAFVVENIS